MSEKNWAIAYLITVLTLGGVHNNLVTIVVILFTLAINGHARFKILKKAFLTLLVFNGTITLSYLLYSFFVTVDLSLLIILNLRALAITLLTFTLMHHINFHNVLSFNHKASLLYALSYSQILLLKKLLNDYYLGLKSRGVTLKKTIHPKQLTPLMATLFGTMLHKSNEQTLGLRSRGLLND